VRAHLKRGREKDLEKIKDIQTYDVPNIVPDSNLIALERPREHDKCDGWAPFAYSLVLMTMIRFYVATDERNQAALKLFRDSGAVLLDDLLTADDRRILGWPLLFTDVRVVVEQALLAHSAFFTGSSLSSVTGGIVNMRAALGTDWRTVFLQ
jgi:hypothetical protein